MKTFKHFLVVVVLAMAPFASGVASPTEVQGGGTEPQSFGRAMTHLGMTKVSAYQLTIAGTPCEPGIDVCVVMNPSPASTDYVNSDVTRIVIPADSTHSIVWPVFHELVQYGLYNDTTTPQDRANFQFNIIVTLDSAALLDTSLINPDTGLPYNGSYQVRFSAAEGGSSSLAPGEHQVRKIRNASTGNALFDYNSLLSLGLPDSVVKKIFSGQITLHLGFSVHGRFVDYGLGNFSMRLIGD